MIMKMQDLENWRPNVQGPENTGPGRAGSQRHDRKLEDKLP